MSEITTRAEEGAKLTGRQQSRADLMRLYIGAREQAISAESRAASAEAEVEALLETAKNIRGKPVTPGMKSPG